MDNRLKSCVFHFCAVGSLVIIPFMPVCAEVSNDVLSEKISSLSQTQTIILEQIQILRDDMNMRFEQVDKRFEQVDKRFEFIQNLLVALIVILVGTTIYSVLGKTKEKKIDDSETIKEVVEREERLEKIISEIVNKDDELRRRLQASGLL